MRGYLKSTQSDDIVGEEQIKIVFVKYEYTSIKRIYCTCFLLLNLFCTYRVEHAFFSLNFQQVLK